MLELTEINTYYSRAHILHDLNMSIGKGECVALLGRNGAGKSTTIKTIVGLVTPKTGCIRFKDKNITGWSDYRIVQEGVGYVPEDRRIFSDLTVHENLCVGQKNAFKISNPWTTDRIYKLFPKLLELKKRKGDTLSGGEQQMLTIARTLMGNPQLLLLDEPTEGLAPVVARQMIAAIDELKKEGISILLSEQNEQTIASLCDKIYILEKGHIVFTGSPDSLHKDPSILQKYLALLR